MLLFYLFHLAKLPATINVIFSTGYRLDIENGIKDEQSYRRQTGNTIRYLRANDRNSISSPYNFYRLYSANGAVVIRN